MSGNYSRLKTDLLKILNAAVSNNLNRINIKWKI